MARKKKTISKKKKHIDDSIGNRIKEIKDLPMVITALFYGRSGTGKTTLSGTFPGPLLLLDIKESGTDSISDTDKSYCLEIKEWKDIENAYWYLEDNPKKFKTVVIDAVHSMQDLAMIKILEDSNKEWGAQVTQRDYGQIANLMKKWIVSYRDLQDLGINVVFLSHDRVTEVDEEGEDNQILPEVGPRVMPSISSTLLGSVKVVGNTFIREEIIKKPGKKAKKVAIEYCLRLGPNGYYSTKIRCKKKVSVPSYIVDPGYEELVNIIKGKNQSSHVKKRTKKKSKR